MKFPVSSSVKSLTTCRRRGRKARPRVERPSATSVDKDLEDSLRTAGKNMNKMRRESIIFYTEWGSPIGWDEKAGKTDSGDSVNESDDHAQTCTVEIDNRLLCASCGLRNCNCDPDGVPFAIIQGDLLNNPMCDLLESSCGLTCGGKTANEIEAHGTENDSKKDSRPSSSNHAVCDETDSHDSSITDSKYPLHINSHTCGGDRIDKEAKESLATPNKSDSAKKLGKEGSSPSNYVCFNYGLLDDTSVWSTTQLYELCHHLNIRLKLEMDRDEMLQRITHFHRYRATPAGSNSEDELPVSNDGEKGFLGSNLLLVPVRTTSIKVPPPSRFRSRGSILRPVQPLTEETTSHNLRDAVINIQNYEEERNKELKSPGGSDSEDVFYSQTESQSVGECNPDIDPDAYSDPFVMTRQDNISAVLHSLVRRQQEMVEENDEHDTTDSNKEPVTQRRGKRQARSWDEESYSPLDEHHGGCALNDSSLAAADKTTKKVRRDEPAESDHDGGEKNAINKQTMDSTDSTSVVSVETKPKAVSFNPFSQVQLFRCDSEADQMLFKSSASDLSTFLSDNLQQRELSGSHTTPYR